MRSLHVTIILTLLLILIGCTRNKELIIRDNVIVAGKILNHDKHLDFNKIKVFEHELLSLGNNHSTYINDDGSYKIIFEKNFSSLLNS